MTDEQRAVLDRQIAEAVMETQMWRECKTVFSFSAVDGEPDMAAVMEAALSEGKTLALPKCLDGEHMAYYRVRELSELKTGMYGIKEPARCGQADMVEADGDSLILIPCLAYDIRGYRLGHGRGYYDRYLAGSDRRAKTMITAYRLQQQEHLPTRREDIAAAWIATEEGVMQSRRSYGH